MIPEDLKYTAQHEWVRESGETARVGITDFAQDQLGDIVFVSLPEVGAKVTAGEPCGELESVKSVSDVYSPLSGTVTARNEALASTPELITSDPSGEGWMYEISVDQSAPAEGILDAAGYQATIG